MTDRRPYATPTRPHVRPVPSVPSPVSQRASQSPTVILRRQAAWKMNLLKWGLGCTGLGMLLFTGTTLIALIVTPLVFRDLLPEQQASLVYRFPFLAALKPTRVYSANVLPTSASGEASALALLSSPVASSRGASASRETPLPAMKGNANDAPATCTAVVAVQPATPLPVGATAQPTPVAVVSVPTVAAPAAFHAPEFALERQKWNNCGPANLVQALRFYGWEGTQETVAAYLKPNREDKNVSPWQMITYAKEKTTLRALTRVAGDLKLIKRLVSQRFAVILEKGYWVASEGWMGHYLTIVGYDDNQGLLHGLDTYLGDGEDKLGHLEKYRAIDELWQQFNRQYIVVYPMEREGELAAILGPQADLSYNAQYALGAAREEASSDPGNPFAWFNLGSSYVLLGQYKEATLAFDRARNVGAQLPWRMLWYQFTPYEAYYNVGNYAEVLALVQATLGTTLYVEETYYWQGMALAAQGRTARAIESFKQALKLNPNYWPAEDRIRQLQDGSFRPPVSGEKP